MTGNGKGDPQTRFESGRDLLYDVAGASALVFDRLCSQWLTWITMPLEFVQAENPRLGVHSTTVFFPKTSAGKAPSVAGAQLVPTGTAAALKVTGSTIEDGKYLVVDVELQLRTQAFAVCSFTLCDPDDTSHSKSYVLPFGIPGGTV